MSRSHMLYNDTAINKVFNIKLAQNWRESVLFRFNNGEGFIIEGNVIDKFNVAIRDDTSGKVRNHLYTAVNIRFCRAYKRSFDSSGIEIEPWKSSRQKVNTGYLMSSYKTVDVETLAIDLSHLLPHLNVLEFQDVLPKLETNSVRVFCNESNFPNLEMNVGEFIRVKTRGNGPYVDYVAKINEGIVTSSEGSSQVSWTDKILSMKREEEKRMDEPEGVDESEWDD